MLALARFPEIKGRSRSEVQRKFNEIWKNEELRDITSLGIQFRSAFSPRLLSLPGDKLSSKAEGIMATPVMIFLFS